ncbi:dehydrogenase [Subtercola boreus]|uniref:Dehydrogenase n=1 Tax=Subtercola boreus TaxID=120213 RepID=A0A3E0VL52_9MICO|nr:Gfo/Idh/MocA family oxidoreductase [Subtercola boreus]RFA10714.1 dehydrogenase [Subtercola boreus]TQL55724.1 putative dehydrogenase [Subtercola boreus]
MGDRIGAADRRRIGVVGYGAGGHFFHTPFIQAVPGWELTGVVTRSDDRRALLATEAPGVPAFDSLDALLDAGVDAVVITTPPETRQDLVLRALERGVHTVADKPFAPDAAAGRLLADAAARSGRILTVFHNRRLDTDIVTLRALITEGGLGDVWRVNSRFDLDDPATLETGPAHGLLRDLGAHLVDQMTHLFGPVARVDAHLDLTRIDGVEVDCGFVVNLHHANGVYTTVSSSKLNHLHEREILAYGSAGSYVSAMTDVQVRQLFSGLRPATHGSGWGVEEPARWGTLRTAAGPRSIPSAAGDYTQYYVQLLAAVRGEGPPPVLLTEALHTLEILDAARQSATEGRSVTLPLP